MGVGIFVCARHSAARFGALGWPASQRYDSTTSLGLSRTLQPGCAQQRIFPGNGDEMTGSKHNPEGNSSDRGEPDPGPYWRRMHRDWRFWIGAVFIAAALAIYVLSGNLSWSPNGHRQPAMPASAAN
jgi:hypothetical protein